VNGHDAPLDYHRRLLDDPHRMDAFERALRRRVRPGDVVLDLGCGTGILGLLALRCGAARVHAVESMPVIAHARALAAQNGVADRIVFHQADAAALAPAEPVDLVVGDFLGAFLVDDLMLPAAAAAARWLKPGGGYIPEEVRLLVAPVGDFGLRPLDGFAAPMYGVDLGPLAAAARAAACRVEIGPAHLLAPPAEYLRYRAGDADPGFDHELSWSCARAGRLRGFAGWFEATLAPGVVLATAPGIETHWGQIFFPIAARAVAAGERVDIRLRLVGPNDWDWERGESAPAAPSSDTDALVANDRGAAAYAADRFAEAAEAWEQAVRLVDPRDDAHAPAIYENLGLAYVGLGRPNEAVRCFLRALDGDPASREQALRFLVTACVAAGRHADAARYRALYAASFAGG
jgi:protein arginine N-methyltransferase 1